MTIDELQAMAERDLNRNLAALEEVCGRFAPGQSVEACMAKMAANKPEGGPVAAARGQLGGLKQFILDRKIVAIPSDDEARIAESPAYARANSAYISIPGPYERNAPATYYISPPDPTWSIEDQQAYIPGTASLLSTTIHEVWPGHFLQFLHSNRSPSMFGRVFVGYAFAEGWAHYTEEMMWEACYRADDPEFRVGQLSDALLRNVRFISAIGLHARGMTVAESERLFREKGFQDPGNARQQAARGTYDPAYLNYTLGKLIIRDLRAEWTAPRGGREAWGAFHDRLLSFGGPPVGLLRGAMMDQSPAPPR
jgi:uncharacterized protein (DUF885 family)